MSEVQKVLDPDMDGISHINIYTKGKTRLGRLITNLADIPVDHPQYGMFRTAEGLWYYLKTGLIHESLRACSGFDAKRLGSTFPTVWFDDFQAQMKIGIRQKIRKNLELYNLFVSSELPFEHYYFYSSKKPGAAVKVVEPKDVRWLTEFITELRNEFKSEIKE